MQSEFRAKNFLVAQLGARMHYAIPRMLHEMGMLNHFYTDICAAKSWPSLLRLIPDSIRPAAVKRLLGRVPNGVPVELIGSFTAFGLEYQRRRTAATSPTDMTQTHTWAGQRFCELILNRGLDDADAVYTFNSAGLELLTEASRRGLLAVMEQTIAPREVEGKLLQAAREKFPDWEPPLDHDLARQEFIERERAEWSQADLILCGSEFVRESILSCGGPSSKCVVVPYGVDDSFLIAERTKHEGPLRVLTVGGVGLRKGSPSVLSAANALRGNAVFRIVGGISVKQSAAQRLASVLELTGSVPRSEVQQHFRWADIFLLPSVCEGSATVIYEALAAGLPVICTPNTGSVVRDGVEGFIVPVHDDEAIINAISSFIRTPDLLAFMSTNALKRAAEFTLTRYQQRLLEALTVGPTAQND